MKFYKRRSSAVRYLKKLGIEEKYYGLFINEVDGGFELYDELTCLPPEKACCEITRALILRGYTNQAVWEVIQPMFDLDDKKKNYPSWQRCHMRRCGKLSQETRINKVGYQVVYE